jgi:hypothetical protein
LFQLAIGIGGITWSFMSTGSIFPILGVAITPFAIPVRGSSRRMFFRTDEKVPFAPAATRPSFLPL